MNVTTAKPRFVVMLILVLAVGFCMAYVSVNSETSALNRVISDYGTLIADLDAAAKELEKQEATAHQKGLLQLKESKRALLEKLSRLKGEQKEVQDLKDSLDRLATSDNTNSPPPPEQRRKP